MQGNDQSLWNSRVQKVERSYFNFTKPRLLEFFPDRPGEKCSFIRGITQCFFQSRNVFLQSNLGVHHVRFGKLDNAARFQAPSCHRQERRQAFLPFFSSGFSRQESPSSRFLRHSLRPGTSRVLFRSKVVGQACSLALRVWRWAFRVLGCAFGVSRLALRVARFISQAFDKISKREDAGTVSLFEKQMVKVSRFIV